jgi:hypothetical protein
LQPGDHTVHLVLVDFFFIGIPGDIVICVWCKVKLISQSKPVALLAQLSAAKLSNFSIPTVLCKQKSCHFDSDEFDFEKLYWDPKSFQTKPQLNCQHWRDSNSRSDAVMAHSIFFLQLFQCNFLLCQK